MPAGPGEEFRVSSFEFRVLEGVGAMATWKTFEDITSWQKGLELGRHVYRCTRESCGRDYPFVNQIRAAVVSIMSNIAEGFERDGTKEFHQFLSIAKGSA